MPGFHQYFDIPCSAPLNSPPPFPNATLLTILLFVRHGMRSPEQLWNLPGNEGHWDCNGTKHFSKFLNVIVNGQPYDHYQYNSSKQYQFPPSCDKGSLINEGTAQLFNLGKLYYNYSLENKLISPINSSYDLSMLFVRSSFVQRCIESALAFLNGFFESYNGTIQPNLEIETGKMFEEPLAPFPGGSKLMYEDALKFIELDEYKNRINRSKEIIKNFDKYLNVTYPIHEIESLTFGDYINTLRCANQEDEVIKTINHDIPTEENLITPDLHREIMNNMLFMEGGFYNFSRAPSIAPIYKLILPKLKKITSKKYKKVFNLFSGHDGTLTALMTAFGGEIEFPPPFASHFTIEVWHQNDSSYVLRACFNGNVIKTIPLKEFKKSAKKLIKEYDEMEKQLSKKGEL